MHINSLQLSLDSCILSLSLLLQNSAQDLSRCSLWDSIGELDTSSQLLVVGDLGGHPIHNLLLRCRVAWNTLLWHNICSWHLSGLVWIIDTNNADIIDIWVGHQDALKLSWWNLETLVLDQLLSTISDVKVAFLVHVSDISSTEESIFGKSVLGSSLVVQVSEEDVWSLDVQLTSLSCWQLFLIWSDKLGDLVWEQTTNRSTSTLPVLPWLGVSRWRGLRKSVTLLDLDLPAGVQRIDNLVGQWCGTGVDHSDRAEIVLVDNWALGQCEDNWWNDVGECNLVVLDDLTEALEVELRLDVRPKTGV